MKLFFQDLESCLLVTELFKRLLLPQGKTCVLSDYFSIWENQSLRSSVGREKEHMLFFKLYILTCCGFYFPPSIFLLPIGKVDTMFKS